MKFLSFWIVFVLNGFNFTKIIIPYLKVLILDGILWLWLIYNSVLIISFFSGRYIEKMNGFTSIEWDGYSIKQ